MTLHRGAREIRILHLGRGHTAGDVIVYLPKERIIATGDLLVESTSYMGDAFFTEWIDTIEAAQAARLRHRPAGPRPGVHRQGQARSLAGVPARLLGAGAEVPQGRRAGGGSRQAGRPARARRQLPAIRALGIAPNHGMLRAYEMLDGKVK